MIKIIEFPNNNFSFFVIREDNNMQYEIRIYVLNI